MNLEMRSPATPASDRAKTSQAIQSTDENISIPIPVQALGNEIRVLRRYVAARRLTKFEAQTRLAAWNISCPPGMYRFTELALLRSYGIEDLHPNEVSEAILNHVEEGEPKKREYRTPQATIDAFLGWIVRQDQATQTRWLADRPKDAAYLRKLWSEKCKAQSK